jgi:hypothetical protein
MSFTAGEFHELIKGHATALPKARPVHVQECAYCRGAGFIELSNMDCRSCRICAGRGYVATEGGEA